MTSETREAVARIIDPGAMRFPSNKHDVRQKEALAKADAILALLPQTPAAVTRCPQCGGRSFAVVDERKPDGHFGPGPDRRCVECKLVIAAPPPVDSSLRDGWSARMQALVSHADKHALPDDEPIGMSNLRWGDLRAALSTIGAPSGGGGWRPIETAPKDEPLLVRMSNGQLSCASLGKSGSISWPYPVGTTPTHWQPLPAAPSVRSGEDKSAPSEAKG